jgi:hypothetical protein
LSDLSDLYLLSDEDETEFEDTKKNEGFLVFLRLSPIPEYLVQGYDFKLLNK